MRGATTASSLKRPYSIASSKGQVSVIEDDRGSTHGAQIIVLHLT
jgi:hypothetical protein